MPSAANRHISLAMQLWPSRTCKPSMGPTSSLATGRSVPCGCKHAHRVQAMATHTPPPTVASQELTRVAGHNFPAAYYEETHTTMWRPQADGAHRKCMAGRTNRFVPASRHPRRPHEKQRLAMKPPPAEASSAEPRGDGATQASIGARGGSNRPGREAIFRPSHACVGACGPCMRKGFSPEPWKTRHALRCASGAPRH